MSTCACGREAEYRQWGDRANEVDDFYCVDCGQPVDECICPPLPGYDEAAQDDGGVATP